MTTPTMRERLARAICRYRGIAPDAPGDEPPAPNWQDFLGDVDAILAELQAEASAKHPDHEGMIYEMARAIGLADSGTDLESIASGRGSYATYMECANAAFTAMIDSIRDEG